MPRTKSQSKYIHGNSPGRGLRADHDNWFLRTPNTPNTRTLHIEVGIAFVQGDDLQHRVIN